MLLLLASRNTTCGSAVRFLTFKAGGWEWFSTDGVGGGLPVSRHACHKGRGTGNNPEQISWTGLLLPGIEHSAVNVL